MKRFALLSASLAVMLALPATPARAENFRSWVASNGSGTACTREAPCRDFQTAYRATSAGGEINCVDNMDGGPVFIIKSITIDCTATLGAITTDGVLAVFVGPGAAV